MTFFADLQETDLVIVIADLTGTLEHTLTIVRLHCGYPMKHFVAVNSGVGFRLAPTEHRER